ncbi:DUF3775 domain-containing protein [Amphritea sp. HPY]|uniref:DUF3775 domain-containing protein n=1 Tax=Amphritea sp. HPY TaxID=3421652 RepID=UPI003D7DAAF7
MLNLNPETVCAFIEKAREFHAKEEVVIPDEADSPAEDWARQILAAHSGDMTYMDAKSIVDDLELDQQAALIALLWLGRGDYEFSEWEQSLADAEETHSEDIAGYLLSKPLLPVYLEEALSLHGYSCQQEREYTTLGMPSDRVGGK